MPKIDYRIGLTGSSFFDTVLIMRAKELIREFPDVHVKVVKGDCIHIEGELPAEGAEKLHAELGYYSNEK